MYGVGYHHAGMDMADRKNIESMFVRGELPVLCESYEYITISIQLISKPLLLPHTLLALFCLSNAIHYFSRFLSSLSKVTRILANYVIHEKSQKIKLSIKFT